MKQGDNIFKKFLEESDFSEYIYSKRGISDWNEGWKLMKICSYSIRIDIKFVRQ